MLKFLSYVLCTSKIHRISLGNYLGTLLIIGSFMRVRVTSIEWTWLELEWPHAEYVALYAGDTISPMFL